MNRLISLLPTLRLRQILIIFLVGITFVVTQAFGYSGQLQAHADTLTPEASAYKVDGTEPGQSKDDNNLPEDVQQNLKGTADNVREKLNLDQPIYSGTKEFLNDVQESVGDTVNTVIGNEKGNNN